MGTKEAGQIKAGKGKTTVSKVEDLGMGTKAAGKIKGKTTVSKDEDLGTKEAGKIKVGKGKTSVSKDEDLGEWYRNAIAGKLMDYTDVSGCYVLHPASCEMWNSIKEFLNTEIKKLGVKNALFPLLVTPEALAKEESHIEGFLPEVAWVTKFGDEKADPPLAIRPTSETIIYPYYSKWIQSHTDLPLKVNQWCSVVRWEFKHPTPFIRSREFIWQEGHTVFATKGEADEEVYIILELYRRVYEELLAVPVIKGIKSEGEKFAGGLYTTTVEAFIPATGRAVQGATSHCLGQNFSQMFDVASKDENGERNLVWQNSWGITTRTIGVMLMVHGDDKGLVLPPRVAPIQIIVIPVLFDTADNLALLSACSNTVSQLRDCGFRAEEDPRNGYTPGFKYAEWESKGVPLRIEIGPRDLAGKKVRVARRDEFAAKEDVPLEKLNERVGELLADIQSNLLLKATKARDDCIVEARTRKEFVEALKQKKMVLAPWCDEVEVEEAVKAETRADSVGGAKTLCMPLQQPHLPQGTDCIFTGKPAVNWALWGRSY